MKKSYEIPKLGDQVEYWSPINRSIIAGTVVEGFVVSWSDDPEDIGCFIPGERYRVVPKKEKTAIEIDFTGEELISISRQCAKTNMTFNQFVDSAIRKYIQ